MTNTHDSDAANAGAKDLLDRLGGATKRDRAAFLFGYILAFDAMAPYLPREHLARHLGHALALQQICAKDFE